MRLIYTLISYLILPVLMLRLLWRARKAPAYARRWSERFAWIPRRGSEHPALWVHSVSVGETVAALPLIHRLMQLYPDFEMVVTTTTPTGSERVRHALGDRVLHYYFPYDLPDCMGRFLNRMRPALVVVMETELWPNLLAACAAREIPVALANARLSERSARGYGRFAGMSAGMMQRLALIAAQNENDAERFRNLGAEDSRVVVTGNIKFDLEITAEQRQMAAACRQQWCSAGPRPIVLAASTHSGEDQLLLEAFEMLRQQLPDALLVLVPRHPERFREVRELAAGYHAVQSLSEERAVDAATHVLIGDRMGFLMPWLGACDLVFMGGTWVDTGGHNFIEPAAWGKPVLSGASLYNFAEVSRQLIEANALRVVNSPQDFAEVAAAVLSQPEVAEAMGESGRRIAERNRGALQRLLQHLQQLV